MSRKSKTRKRAEQQSTGESRVLQMSLVEAAEILRENWGDILDPLAQVADDFGAGYRYSTVSQVGDRRRGENRPIFSTETELAVIRGSCRLIHDTYGTAQCALENLISFVLGKGLIVKTSSLPGAPSALASAVQVEIDRALAATKWQTVKEEEEYRRCVRDGETFLAIMPVDNTVRLRFIEPEQITEPAESTRIADWIGASSAGEWSFGVHTRGVDPDTAAPDSEGVLGYYVQWTDTAQDWHYFPEAQLVHTKRNVDSTIKRGLSDFYCIQNHLTNIGKLERNVAVGAAILSAIIGIRQHAPGVSQSQIQTMLSNRAYSQKTTPIQSGSKLMQVTRYNAGTFIDIPRGMEYKASPLANQGVGEAFVTIEQALLRTVGSRWAMPEYLISGKIDANYAGTLVGEAPFVRFCERQQSKLCLGRAELLWKILAVRCKAGAFRKWGVFQVEELEQLVAIAVTGPIVAARNRTDETTRRKLLNESGILSAETWSEEEGYDREREVERGAQRVAMPGQEPALLSPDTPRPADDTGHPLMKESIRDRARAAVAATWRERV